MTLLVGGLVRREPFYCEECGRPIEPYALALCADGYQRIYGEFVLSDSDSDEEGHEYNWPETHAECVPAGKGGYGAPE